MIGRLFGPYKGLAAVFLKRFWTLLLRSRNAPAVSSQSSVFCGEFESSSDLAAADIHDRGEPK